MDEIEAVGLKGPRLFQVVNLELEPLLVSGIPESCSRVLTWTFDGTLVLVSSKISHNVPWKEDIPARLDRAEISANHCILSVAEDYTASANSYPPCWETGRLKKSIMGDMMGENDHCRPASIAHIPAIDTLVCMPQFFNETTYRCQCQCRAWPAEP